MLQNFRLIVFILSLSGFGLLFGFSDASATISDDDDEDKSHKDLPLDSERTISLQTDEGSWMSLDIHPDGSKIIFDFMGDLYELPIEGGEAERLTRGMAFDSQPKYHPDGDKVAFISDRSGGENIWFLDLESGETTQRTRGNNYRRQSPEWTPSGDYIIGARAGLRSGVHKLRMYHIDGGSGTEFISASGNTKMVEPAFGDDDRYLWFSQRSGDWDYNATFPQYQIAKYDREEGKRHSVTSRHGSAFRPTVSHDNNTLVYGTRHETETGLRKRDLNTGDEQWLAYPVQRDDKESRATRDVLPSMAFTPDDEYIVTSYGGKFWQIPIDGGEATEIPFEVDAELDMGPELLFDYEIEDTEEFLVSQIRDGVPSPDGDQLAFTALNQLYIMDLPDGTPERFTEMDRVQSQPTWSPDGRYIAFTTWHPDEGGHIYRKRTSGFFRRSAQRLTEDSGVYQQPAWSKTQDRIVAIRGDDRTYNEAPGPFVPGATDELIWIPSDGGESKFIARTEGRSNPHFIEDDDRIYLNHSSRGLISLRYDGTDERRHLRVVASPPPSSSSPQNASEILMAPKGDQAIARVNNDLYAVTVPQTGSTPSVNVSNPDNASFPVEKLTDIGGQFPAWASDGNRIHWSIGSSHFVYDIEEAEEQEQKIEAYEEEKEEREDENDEEESEENDEENDVEEDRPEDYEPGEYEINLQGTRDTPQGAIALQGARVITMDDYEVIENADILIKDSRIEAVGEAGEIDIPDDAEVRDVSGKTIVPGFVDTHAHVRPHRNLHQFEIWSFMANLAYGVTSIRDAQPGTTDLLTYGDMVTSGDILGPRIFQTGPGIFWQEQIDDQEHAENVLKRYSKYYSTNTIKMYVTGNRQQRQWILNAAKDQELMPTTEGSLDLKLNLTQLIDGYPGQEHNYPVTPLYSDIINTTAESQMAYTPTLLVTYGGPWAENYFYATEDLIGDSKLEYFTPRADLDSKIRRRDNWFADEEYVMDRQSKTVRQIYDEGGILGVGSHGQLQGLGYHWELWAMAWDDVDPHEALRMATLHGAKAIGKKNDLGSIEEGKLADLVILEDNPLDNIRNTNTITQVMKNGRLYDGDTLEELWPEQREPEHLWWQHQEPDDLPGINNME